MARFSSHPVGHGLRRGTVYREPMLTFIAGLVLGIYAGGGIVTAITVQSIDGQETTWRASLFVGLFWWYVLLDARRNSE